MLRSRERRRRSRSSDQLVRSLADVYGLGRVVEDLAAHVRRNQPARDEGRDANAALQPGALPALQRICTEHTFGQLTFGSLSNPELIKTVAAIEPAQTCSGQKLRPRVEGT